VILCDIVHEETNPVYGIWGTIGALLPNIWSSSA